MLSNLLDRLHRAVAARPRATLLVAAFATVVAAVLGAGIELRTSTRELVPPGDPAQARWEALQRDFHDPEPLILVIEGGEQEQRRTAADRIAATFAERAGVAQVHYRIHADWLAEHLLWLTSPDALEALAQGLGELVDGSEPIEVGSIADIVDRVTGRLQRSLGAGAPARGDAGEAGADRLRDAAGWLLRWLRDPETTFGEIPAAPRELVLARAGVADDAGYLTTSGGRLLMFVTRDGRDDGRAGEAAFVAAARDLAATATADLAGVRVGMTGPPAMTADEMAAIRSDTRRTSVIAIAGVGLLAMLAFHRRRYAVLGLATLAAGVIWSLGAVRLELGYLNMITTALVPILVGVGIDYAVHPLSQFEVERRAGFDPPAAAARAFRLTSTALLVSALTTAAAFFCFLWMDFRGFSELGLVTGIGVLLCLLAALVVLPALLAWWPLTGRERRRTAPLDRFWGPRQAAALCSRPVPVLTAAAVLTVGAGFGASRVELRTGLVDLLPAGAESLRYLEIVADDPGFSAWVNVITADDLEQLAAQRSRASAEPSIARFESADSLLPRDPARSADALERLRDLLDRLRVADRGWDGARLASALVALEGALADAADAAFVGGEASVAGALESARVDVAAATEVVVAAPTALAARWPQGQWALQDLLRRWQGQLESATAVPPPVPATLPAELHDRLVTRSGKLVAYLHPRDGIFDPERLAEFNRASMRVAPDAVGFPVLFERMSRRITSGFGEALALAAILIVALLMIDLRGGFAVLLALTPVVLGTVWLIGLMGALGIGFNLANLIAIPLVLGVGIDNGVHLMHRHRIDHREPIASVLAQTGRAILIASLTTMIGFGSLALASHRGMASLGLLLLLGVGACMVASLVVLPNLLSLLARRR